MTTYDPNNPSRLNFSANVEKARQEAVAKAQSQYGLSTAKQVATALGISLYSTQRYTRNKVFVPRMIVRAVKLYDLDLCRVQLDRHREIVSQNRATQATLNHAAYLASLGLERQIKPAEVQREAYPKKTKPVRAVPWAEIAPKTIKIIPTKTPIARTKGPAPKHFPNRGPSKNILDRWLDQLRAIDPIASRQIDREIDGKIPCPPRPEHMK